MPNSGNSNEAHVFTTGSDAVLDSDTPATSPTSPGRSALLIQQYRDATTPGTVEVAVALRWEVQDLLTVLEAFFDAMMPPDALGVNLDRLGALIGEPRLGKTDTQYVPWILAKIRANRSSGTTEDIISVFLALIGNLDPGQVKVSEYYPAAIVVRLFTLLGPIPGDVNSQLGQLLKLSKKAGVGAVVVYLTTDSAHTFSFDGGDGLGFGDATDASVGGQFAGAASGD